ncbi:hypothetical protein P7K49_026690, partial [Saguinus oedipus]
MRVSFGFFTAFPHPVPAAPASVGRGLPLFTSSWGKPKAAEAEKAQLPRPREDG